MFHELWDGFVDESCRANMPKAEACLYGELGTVYDASLLSTLIFFFTIYKLLACSTITLIIPPAPGVIVKRVMQSS